MGIDALKIAAIDDVQDNLTSLKAVVMEAFPGTRFISALNGAKGIEMVLAEDPDVILLDIVMPGMDGFEVCRRLKSDERTKHIPVVFLTARQTDRNSRIKALETGAEAFLSKPIEEAELTAQIRAMVKIKLASIALRQEKQKLSELVAERTRELELELAEHRRTGEALRASENKYRELFESASDAIFIHDLNGKMLDVNRVACDRLGYSREDLLQLTPGELDTGEHGERVSERMQQLLANKHQVFKACHARKDGGQIHTEISSRLIAYEGQPAVLSAARDITERKLIEDTYIFLLQCNSASSEEDFFESLARYLAQSLEMDFVCIDRLLDDGVSAQTVGNCLDGRFEERFVYALKDTPCGETVGKSICIIKQGVRDLFPQNPVLLEMGAESYVGTTLWSFDGQPIGLISVVGRRPLPDPQTVEAVLKLVAVRAAGELERRQAEKERQYLEQQFQHSQKLESLGVLAGGIAHDFNNILTVIMGHCYVARENLDPEQSYKTHIRQIETAANRAADLCRQMLTYAGKNPLIQTRVNLGFLVNDVVMMLQSAIKKNVVIELDLERDLPDIDGDSGQIQQIVMNLIINAAEAIGDTNGTIRIVLAKTVVEVDQAEKDTFGKVIRAGRYACLEVTDTGCGMDEETQKRVFEPFYTTKFTGRGLGMSVIRGIVKSHDGTLQLTSRPGVGTTLKVCFPLLKAPKDAATVPAAAVPRGSAGGRILLVDDEEELRDLGVSLLGAFGYSSMTAQHGLEAVEIFREHASGIDMILLDLVMPVMGGIEAYHELRKIAPVVPIIICSGYGVESVSDFIDQDEYAGFVNKPYKPNEIADLMVRMIGAGA